MLARLRPAVARAATVALLLGACSHPTVASRPNIAQPDLGAIVLSARDAPPGTRYVEEVSGFQDIEAFAVDAAELDALREDGFEVGHLALFVPADRQSLRDPLSGDEVLVQGIAGLFASPEGASRALGRFVEGLRSRQIPDHRDLDASGLGDEAEALTGTVAGGTTVVAFAFRRANLVLAVTGQGAVSVEDARAIAEILDQRAIAS